MGQDNPALEGLPEPGEPVFYPKVGHCIYRGVTEDRVAPGTELLELEDLEEGSRILIPLPRVPQLNLRPAGTAFQEIQDVLGAEFEEPLEDEEERHELVDKLITDGSPRALAQSLKRLHLLRQTTGLSREEEQTRKKIRSWLAAEVSISRECTRAEAQVFMTRILQEAMAQHEKKEKQEAKERRRAAREQKKAEEAEAAEALAASAAGASDVFAPQPEPEPEPPSPSAESAEPEASAAPTTSEENKPEPEPASPSAESAEPEASAAPTTTEEANPEPEPASPSVESAEPEASAAPTTTEREAAAAASEAAPMSASADSAEPEAAEATEAAEPAAAESENAAPAAEPEARPESSEAPPRRAEEESPIG